MAVEQYDELGLLGKAIMKSLDFYTDPHGNLDREGILNDLEAITRKSYKKGYEDGYNYRAKNS